jgi:glutaredoxin
MSTITMYGTKWCGDCARSRQVLTRAGVPFVELDVDEDAAAALAAREASGGSRVPVVVFPDGRVFVEPSNPDLMAALSG